MNDKIKSYFEKLVIDIKKILNNDIKIFTANHDKMGRPNTCGAAWSRTGKAKDVYMITIDNSYIEFNYELKFEFGQDDNDLIKTICHEIAHANTLDIQNIIQI